MARAPDHPHELRRQQALDSLHVLDTLPEKFSDAVAAMAAAIAGVPISAISLVDRDRQWFKSACGLPVAETPRDMSFCAHAILQTEPLIVSDALADTRFQDNALVIRAPFIRFYAGFPIIVRGLPVGALCVIDQQSRVLTASAIDSLTKLAHCTSAWLSDRQQLQGSLDRAQDQIENLTWRENRTELPNRTAFLRDLTASIHRCGPESLAVLLIHIDGHDNIRDAWGSDTGDQAMREVSARLRALTRSTDLVAYAGTDQYVMLLIGAGAEAAKNAAARIGAKVIKPVVIDTRNFRLTASIGISIYPAHGDAERLIQRASAAMTAVRRSGGDSFRFFDDAMMHQAQARLDLVSDLRDAVQRQEFELHYQPKIDAKSGQVSGLEALVRWNRPGHGLIGPGAFIAEAENSGLIVEIGRWVIGEACRQMQVWLSTGIKMRVAVNVSAHQLRDSEFAVQLSNIVRRHGVDARLITCEITESVAMNVVGGELAALERLRAIGVQISIDDFGTGYSSLGYLRQLHVQQLKVDRSFVTDLASSEDARVVTAAIVKLGHALNLEIVAEGVETEAQRDILLDMGCDKLQGYLFARPMSASAITNWIGSAEARCREFRSSLYSTSIPR